MFLKEMHTNDATILAHSTVTKELKQVTNMKTRGFHRGGAENVSLQGR